MKLSKTKITIHKDSNGRVTSTEERTYEAEKDTSGVKFIVLVFILVCVLCLLAIGLIL